MAARPKGWRVLQWTLVSAGTILIIWTAARRYSLRPEILATKLPSAARGQLSIVVLFQPKDCASYGNFLQVLGALKTSDSIPVIGAPLLTTSTSATVPAFPSLDPPFPIRPELGRPVAALMSRMGYHMTPVAVLIDPVGRPLMVIPPHPVPFQQAEIVSAIQTYVRSVRAGGMMP